MRLASCLLLAALFSGCTGNSPEAAPPVDGRTAPRGMRLEALEIAPDGSGFTVRTTGAVIRADLQARRITVGQRIGAERPVATIEIGEDVAAVLSRAARTTAFELTWGGQSPGEPTVIVAGDSTIRLREIRTLGVTLDFAPLHVHVRPENGGLLAFDGTGGVVVIPPVAAPPSGQPPQLVGSRWTLAADAPLAELVIAACPPRPFDAVRADQRVVHYSSHVRRYPSDAEIAAMARYARVLELHSWVWKDRWVPGPGYPETYRNGEPGMRPPWDDLSYQPMDGRFVPEDEAELLRVVRTAHALGMKVAPYLGGALTRAEDVAPEARRIRDAYGVDGVYLDGMPGAPLEEAAVALSIARELRAAFGNEGWLNFHNTHSGYFHPFVQAYMDFVTTSEHLAFDRWTSTTQGMSNAIGGLWPEVPYFFTDPALNQEDAIPLIRSIVDEGRPYGNRLLLLQGEGGQWRFWRLYFTPAELEFALGYAAPGP